MPLKDSGDRTDLCGSGALRDINPENGRCDLLPAYSLLTLTSHLVTSPKDCKSPVLSNVLHYLLQYMDTKNIQFLNESIQCLSVYHWCKVDPAHKSSLETTSRDVIVANTLLDLSLHYKRGAEKYAERNWEKGIPAHSFIDSAIRHLCKELLDWKDEPHDIACLWNVVGLIWTLHYHPEFDDMPNYNERRNSSDTEKENTDKTQNKVEKED